MKKRIVDVETGKRYSVTLTPEEEQEVLDRVVKGEAEETARLEKEAQRQATIERLKKSTNSDVQDLLSVLLPGADSVQSA